MQLLLAHCLARVGQQRISFLAQQRLDLAIVHWFLSAKNKPLAQRLFYTNKNLKNCPKKQGAKFCLAW